MPIGYLVCNSHVRSNKFLAKQWSWTTFSTVTGAIQWCSTYTSILIQYVWARIWGGPRSRTVSTNILLKTSPNHCLTVNHFQSLSYVNRGRKTLIIMKMFGGTVCFTLIFLLFNILNLCMNVFGLDTDLWPRINWCYPIKPRQGWFFSLGPLEWESMAKFKWRCCGNCLHISSIIK